MLLERGGHHGRPLSPTTVRTVHRVLSKALGDAVREELIEHNPVSRAVAPKRRRYEATVWTAEEALRFLTAVRAGRLYAAWLVALSCGLRRGELSGLRWRDLDLDLDRGTLSVTTQRTTDTDYRIITKAPKGTGRRTVDLGDGTVAALRAHRQAQMADVADLHGLLLPVDGDGPEYVFVAEDLQPLHPQRLTDLFQRAAKAAGVPVIRLHDARHSCATLALDAGVHPKVVQQLLGHSSWSTTMDLYSHRVDRLQREATQRIEGLLLPPKEVTGGPGVAEGADQRANGRGRQPAASGHADRSGHHERVWDALAAGPARRPPFRRPPDGAGSGLYRLQELRESRTELDKLIASEVRALIALGADWGTIGRALGVSRQAARQRYGSDQE
jgi:integrase